MLMRNSGKLTAWTIGVLILAYAAVALSPIKSAIGRRSPGVASWFSPPLFNFSQTYTDGSVLGFSAGMNKGEVFSELIERYADSADLTVNCVVTTADSVIPITHSLDIATVYGGGHRLCVRLDSRRLAVDFEFVGNFVSKIEITFVRTESF